MAEPDDDSSRLVWALSVLLLILFTLTLQSLLGSSSSTFHARRVQHVCTGVAFYCVATYTSLGDKDLIWAAVLLSIGTSWVYGMHRWRLNNPKVKEFLQKHYKNILRESEITGRIPGAFYFMFGVSVATWEVLLWDNMRTGGMRAWRLAVLFLSVGDPVASLVGEVFGSASKSKSWQGSLAMWVVCAACAWSERRDLVYCAIAGMVGALAEFAAWPDDNFSIPTLSCAALLILNELSVEVGVKL